MQLEARQMFLRGNFLMFINLKIFKINFVKKKNSCSLTYDINAFFKSVRTVFGDSEEGRTRLYQSADVVLLLLNNGMKGAAGVCTNWLRAPEGTQKSYRFATFVASYSKCFKNFMF